MRCLFPRDQEPHAQPRARPRELSKHQEQRTLGPFPKACREIGARCLVSPFTDQRHLLCAMWSMCRMVRALSGIQVQGRPACASGSVLRNGLLGGFTQEQTQNSTEPRQSHSSFTSDKAHLDKTAHSMWPRLVTTRPVSDQKQKYSVDVLLASRAVSVHSLPSFTLLAASFGWLYINGQESGAETMPLAAQTQKLPLKVFAGSSACSLGMTLAPACLMVTAPQCGWKSTAEAMPTQPVSLSSVVFVNADVAQCGAFAGNRSRLPNQRSARASQRSVSTRVVFLAPRRAAGPSICSRSQTPRRATRFFAVLTITTNLAVSDLTLTASINPDNVPNQNQARLRSHRKRVVYVQIEKPKR